MALFKVFRGKSTDLPEIKTDGYCYFTTDDQLFYIDYKDENGEIQRAALNAGDAETILGASLSTVLNYTDEEFPTSKAVLDAVGSAVLYTSQELTEEQKAQARANISKYNWKTFSDDYGTYTYSIEHPENKKQPENKKLDFDIAQTILNVSGNGSVSALEDMISWMPISITECAYTTSISNVAKGLKYIAANFNALKNGCGIYHIIFQFPKKIEGSSDYNLEEALSTVIVTSYTTPTSMNHNSTHGVFSYCEDRFAEYFYNEQTDSITYHNYQYKCVDKSLSRAGFAADAKAVGDALALKADNLEEIDAIELATKTGLVSPTTADDGAIYTDENGVIYSL